MRGLIKKSVTVGTTAIDEETLVKLRGRIIEIEWHPNGGYKGGTAETSFDWYWRKDQIQIVPDGQVVVNEED